MNSEEAREALAGVDRVDRQLADRLSYCPPWRHAAFGLVLTLFVGSETLPSPYQWFGIAAGYAGILLVLRWDLRNQGVFISGFRRNVGLTVLLLGVTATLLIAANHMREQDFSVWSRVAITLITFAIATATSVAWHRRLLRQLRHSAS